MSATPTIAPEADPAPRPVATHPGMLFRWLQRYHPVEWRCFTATALTFATQANDAADAFGPRAGQLLELQVRVNARHRHHGLTSLWHTLAGPWPADLPRLQEAVAARAARTYAEALAARDHALAAPEA